VDAAGFGWTLAPASFDWPTLVAAKEKEISRLSAIYRNNLDKAGVAIEDSRAEIVDAHGVRLIADGRKLSARIILISTGGAPVLEPDIPGREYAITSNEKFSIFRHCKAYADCWRRLYRGRVRCDFRAARHGRHACYARRKCVARF